MNKWLQVANYKRTLSLITFYSRAVHSLCVQSVDQVDPHWETKYLFSLCTSVSMWNTNSRPGLCQASTQQVSWDFLIRPC